MKDVRRWTEEDIPAQNGRIAVVTGANSGIGYSITRALALKGARVVMACRNLEKGELARQKIMDEGPVVEPELWKLDLAQLESVHSFAGKYLSTHSGPDLLINNAGVMATPYKKTSDGFELQFGVNHLGHFALTALLWPGMKSVKGARVVNVSSNAHHFGNIRFEDIHWEKKYSKWSAYGMSKLANMLFTKEMARRLMDSDTGVTVAAAHPGYVGSGSHSRSAPGLPCLSPRTLRRHGATHHDRNDDDSAARHHHRRRADLGSGRDRSAASVGDSRRHG